MCWGSVSSHPQIFLLSKAPMIVIITNGPIFQGYNITKYCLWMAGSLVFPHGAVETTPEVIAYPEHYFPSPKGWTYRPNYREPYPASYLLYRACLLVRILKIDHITLLYPRHELAGPWPPVPCFSYKSPSQKRKASIITNHHHRRGQGYDQFFVHHNQVFP